MKEIIINDQKNTIHRLQQECTEKTNAIIALGEQLKAKEQECEKLKETLAEIKEIAEENIRIADLEGLNGVYRRGLAKQILQKIRECEVK